MYSSYRVPFSARALQFVGLLLYLAVPAIAVLFYLKKLPWDLTESITYGLAALLAGIVFQAMGSVVSSLARIARALEGPQIPKKSSIDATLDQTTVVDFSTLPPVTDQEVYERLYKAR